MDSIVGKWIIGDHHVYEFFESGIFETYTTADRSKGIMGRYSIIGENSLKLTTPLSDNILEFSIYGNTLTFYPDDGGTPIEFKQTY